MWSSGIPGHNSSRIVRPPIRQRHNAVPPVTVVKSGTSTELDAFATGIPGVFDPVTGGSMVFNQSTQRLLVRTTAGTQTVAWTSELGGGGGGGGGDEVIVGPSSGRRFKLSVNAGTGALEISKESGIGTGTYGTAVSIFNE